MKARFYQFNLGGRPLGWPTKILFSVLALTGIALVVSFGLLAIVFAVAVFGVMKLVGGLRQALGLSPEIPPTSSCESSITIQTNSDNEKTVIVHDIEVEVLPVEREPK